jgi:hypothetical protein
LNTIGYGRARFEVPLHEAAREAPFQMFVPERVPSEYKLRLTNVPGRDRPPLPAAVMLWYRTEDAAAALTISETTPDTPGVLDWIGTGAAPVEEIEHRGGRTRVRGATAKWRQTQLAFVRDRTAIAISSTEFDADSLVELASRLVPAPTTVQSREVSLP